MEKFFKKAGPICMICIVCAAAAFVGVFYFHFLAERINEDSAVHLKEIYGQVNRSFGSFAERNWTLLDSWGERLSRSEDSEDEIADFLEEEQQRWGFTLFYFLSENKTYMTLDGAKKDIDLGEVWDTLMKEKAPIMAEGDFSTGQDATAFAYPVAPGTYKGFSYDAIAISYTSEALVTSLDVDAFAGQAKCFVIRTDGSVLLSTQPGGNVFSNYLTYLNATSDMDSTQLSQVKSDWESGKEGLLWCRINGEEYCILYQPVSYHGYVLLSVVPQKAVSAGLMQVQKTTMNTMLLIFIFVSVIGIALIAFHIYNQSQKSKTELAYRDSMFDIVSNSVDDIFLMFEDDTYTVDYISPNVERLLGIPVSEVRKDIRAITKCAVDFDVMIPQEKMRAIPLNGSIDQECEYLHQKTGERRWYRMTVYRVSISGTEKYINILSDRTQERKMNQTLQEALMAAKSANEAKSNFLSNVSHDIRTPMNAIVGFSTLLAKDADKVDKVREYTHKITASSQHLLSLINEVLDMSKIESGKTSLNAEVFQLPELLDNLKIIMLPQAKARGQKFTIRIQGSPPEQLIGDRLHLNQIFINLLSNAVKYTPENGKIDFVISQMPEASSQIARLRFVVKDNGIGMSQEYLTKIFNPFSREVSSLTNKVQGTGLGMAITKNLIDLMGGVISVESELGKGSTFTVDLSFALPENDATENWYQDRIRKILVADDEPDVCQTIEKMMADTGVSVLCVPDGAAAVEAAVAAHRSGEGYDVILLDWKMPVMDGVEAAKQIRREVGDEVPILVLTAYDWGDIEDEAREAGIHAFMPKPFFVSNFWHTIRPLFSDAKGDDLSAEEIKADSVLEGRHFLVVEDNDLNAEILTEMLAIEGASCELALNGKEAVELFLKSAPDKYDMILMDVQMPVMDGYEATRRIRGSRHPRAATIPIIAMTANTFAEDVRMALDAGMNDHVGKPINMDTFRGVVERLLSSRGE